MISIVCDCCFDRTERFLAKGWATSPIIADNFFYCEFAICPQCLNTDFLSLHLKLLKKPKPPEIPLPEMPVEVFPSAPLTSSDDDISF